MSVIINGGGGGGAASFTTLTGGTNTGNSFVLGNGSSISTTGTGTIGAAGSNGQLQYNNSGVLGGMVGSVVNGANGSGTLSIIAQSGFSGPIVNINSVGGVGGSSYFTVGGSGTAFFFIDSSARTVINSSVLIQSSGSSAVGGYMNLGYDSTTNTMNFNVNNTIATSPTGAWNNVNVTPVTVNANVATDQNLMSASVLAGTLNRVGRTFRIWISGVFSTPAASTSVVTVKVKLGALTLATWTPTALPTVQATNNQFNVSAYFTTQTAGAAAAFEGHGNLIIDLGAGNLVADSNFADVNTATVGTLDSTAAQTLQVTIAFSNASASNTATQRQMVIETIN
jgi:hypothetical protein